MSIELAPSTTEPGKFLIRPKQALAQITELQSVVKEVMKEDEHYGLIPGVAKKSLFKPGAELLCNMYQLFLDPPEIVEKIEEWNIPVSDETFPLFRYLVRCTLRDRSGTIIASGVGECNSFESKYRFRAASRSCPECGERAIIKGKKQYGGGFICWSKKGGCGKKFTDKNEKILAQPEGKMSNKEIFDQINTLIKMAKKRAFIDATLTATRTSGIFTQDVEDFAGIQDVEVEVLPTGESVDKKTGEVKDTGRELKFQNEIVPFGFLKGRKFCEIPEGQLRGAIAYAEKHNIEPDFIKKANAFLSDTGLPFDDEGKINPEPDEKKPLAVEIENKIAAAKTTKKLDAVEELINRAYAEQKIIPGEAKVLIELLESKRKAIA